MERRLGRGSAQEWPLIRIIRLIGDSSEFNFLDNRSAAATSRVNEYTA
jgi:hypothetical protein